MSSPRQRLRLLLREDETWKRFTRIAKNSWPVEFDGYEEEVASIHKARPVRLLTAQTRPNGKRLVEATLGDQSYRSRIVEITMSVHRVKAFLASTAAITKRHIEAKYSRDLVSFGLRGVRERGTVINSLFVRSDELLTKYETLLELCDMVRDDIDSAGFALQRSVKSLEIATRRESGGI